MKNYRISILCAIIFTMLVFLLFNMDIGMVLSWDTNFHLLRISGILENISNGVSNHINYVYNNGFGYAAPLFYTDIMIYPIVYLISFFTKNNMLIFIIIILFYMFITYTLSAISYFKIKNNIIQAQIFAIMYSLCNYHIYNIYYRGALSEYIAMSFLPLFILSIYKINKALDDKVYNSVEYFYFFICMIFVVFSHALTSIMLFYLYLIALLVIYIKHFRSYKYIFRNLLISSTFILGCASIYLLPLIEQIHDQKFYFQLSKFQHETSGYDFETFKNTIITINGIFNVFITIPIIVFIYLFIKKKNDFFTNLIFILFICSAFFITSLFPAKNIIFLSSIQYQWRFTSFLWLFSIFYSVYSIDIIFNFKYGKYIRWLYIILLLSFPIMNAISVREDINNKDLYKSIQLSEYNKSIGRGEYLPEKIELDYINNYQNIDSTVTYNSGVYHVKINNENMQTYELPIIYYKGYSSHDNVIINESENGLIEVDPNGNITFDVFYQETRIQNIAKGIYIVTIIFALLYYLHIFGIINFVKRKV